MTMTRPGTMSPEEHAVFAAMTERMRQLRRRHGVPNGVSLADAVTLHMLSATEVEEARWGIIDVMPSSANASPS